MHSLYVSLVDRLDLLFSLQKKRLDLLLFASRPRYVHILILGHNIDICSLSFESDPAKILGWVLHWFQLHQVNFFRCLIRKSNFLVHASTILYVYVMISSLLFLNLKEDMANYFLKLRRWWKGVDIFEKAYILLPVHAE